MKIFKLEISNRLILGCLMLGFGAIVAYSGVYTASYGPKGTREHVNVSPGPLYPFWLPISYDVIRVPDYSIGILTIGVIIATTGFWIVVYDISHRAPPLRARSGEEKICQLVGQMIISETITSKSKS